MSSPLTTGRRLAMSLQRRPSFRCSGSRHQTHLRCNGQPEPVRSYCHHARCSFCAVWGKNQHAAPPHAFNTTYLTWNFSALHSDAKNAANCHYVKDVLWGLSQLCQISFCRITHPASLSSARSAPWAEAWKQTQISVLFDAGFPYKHPNSVNTNWKAHILPDNHRPTFTNLRLYLDWFSLCWLL